MKDFTERIIASRKPLISGLPDVPLKKLSEEGGCGVVGFAATVPVRGRHIFEPCIQMHNRGNGKGGGIAAACLNPEQLGVDADTLRDDYIVQVALLDSSCESRVEKECITADLDVRHKMKIEPVADYADVGLETRPPDIVRYFVRAKDDAVNAFAEEHGLVDAPRRFIEDELIYRNSVKLNQAYYASLGEQRAFVLSHARNLVIFKIVGYAEQVVQYYGLEDMEAKVWIAHQRYPTKGRVWHPGGAHPFIGTNEALVHNGDFANFHSVCSYLKQNNIVTQFLTDTEASVLLFDLWRRVYGYPIEYVIEAMAPTTELDFDRLPEEKKKIYRAIQRLHMHGSPDGPWFFIIARTEPDNDISRLIGITDTAMLRPQVFAIQDGDVSIGLVASEKQAIDATLHSLSVEDPRFRRVADKYWNARGGSHTDGGAFLFELSNQNGDSKLTCTDKFGREIRVPEGEYAIKPDSDPVAPEDAENLISKIGEFESAGDARSAFEEVASRISSFRLDNVVWLMAEIEKTAEKGDDAFTFALELLTMLIDRRIDFGGMKRGAVLQLLNDCITRTLDAVPSVENKSGRAFARIEWANRDKLRAPEGAEKNLVIYAWDFPPEGPDCDSQLAAKAFGLGWKSFIVYGLKGQRFHGCAFGPETWGVRFDIYGSSGDYLASGIDGMEIHVHNNAQDQLAQIMKEGKLVIHGDVGQAFMYGAKGGDVYVLGNGAGRPLINAVGKPRVVINGTCLDYLAESFMAGDPHNGGGFVILNGMEFDDTGNVREQATPYPGSNLFSMASGGAIFVRDPRSRLVPDQLNGGEFAKMDEKDWELIKPHLEENERLFGISVERDLLTVDGEVKSPLEVYRKVRAVKLEVLAKQSVPE